MKFIIIIYTTNKLTVVEMEDIRGVRLRKFKLRKIVLGVRMHFRHNSSTYNLNTTKLIMIKFLQATMNGPLVPRLPGTTPKWRTATILNFVKC